MGQALEFTTDNFDSEVLQSDQPVLVDFWATWCQPCRRIAPLIDELAVENQGGAKVGKLNIDDSPKIAEQYGISSIPAILVFKGGEVQERMVGLQPKERIQQSIEAAK